MIETVYDFQMSAPSSFSFLRQLLPGGHGGEEIPVPIPNTEVKLPCADDTASKRESRQLPGFFLFLALFDCPF